MATCWILKKIDAGVLQGSVLSATLFLLHLNDLLVPGTFGYADDSTVADRSPIGGMLIWSHSMLPNTGVLVFLKTEPSTPVSATAP